MAPSSGQAPQQQAPGNGNNSNKIGMATSQSPGGSEPDQYRTGSSLSSGIGLSPGSGTGMGNHIRSMTPDSDSMRTNNTGGGGTGGMGSSNSGGANARSGSMSMDKSDIFGVRPASSGSANNSGFVVNPENLLNAAAQMASAFAASDMDYLGKYFQNCFVRDHSYITVLCISVGPRPKRLETRVIIKISTHPCYPRTFDYFSWD